MRRVLITGGTGLYGSAVQNLLQDTSLKDTFKNDVFHFSSSTECDLLHKSQIIALFTSFKPTHVLHLAAKVGGLFDNMDNNIEFFEKNMIINMNLLGECHRSGTVVKTVSCMSTCIFPDKNVAYPLTTCQLHNGLPHESNIGYAFAKRMIDVENRILFTPTKPFIGVIPTNMFGPHDNFSITKGHVIPALIHKCFLAKRDNIDFIVKGSGRAVRQFLYSKDAAKLLLRIMDEYDGIEPLIIAPQEELSISQVVNEIVNLFDFKGNVVYTDEEEDSGKNDGQLIKTADGSAILRIFPDFTFTNFKDGLKETIDWFIMNNKL